MRALVYALLIILNFGTFAIVGFLGFAMAYGAEAEYAWLIPAVFAALSMAGKYFIDTSRFGKRVRT